MKNLANPNYIYIGTFTIPFIVYLLGWSTIYPELSNELLIFYFFTFAVCLSIGYLVKRFLPFKFNTIPVSRYNTKIIVAIIIFFIVDCLYAGRIPLFSIASGEDSYEGGHSFGIPTVHVLMVTFTLFYSLYIFHQYISNKSTKLLVTFLSTLLPFIFLLQRSNIMYIFIGATIIYTLSLNKLKLKRILQLGIFSLFFIYVFGYLGNVRSGNGDSTFIPKLSGVTDDFLNGPIPNEFYWGYLYIGSPVANLQNNINAEPDVRPDFESFAVYELFPDFLTKKADSYFSVQQRLFHQLNNFLNVGTIYANSFSYLSWPGLFIMFTYLMLLMNFYYVVINKSSKYKVAGIAMMFNVIAYSAFTNTIQFSAYSLPLVFPILITVIKQFKPKPKKTQYHYAH